MHKNNRELPIGIFDSGMGGLTVLHELMKQLPCERFLYLGDTARLPYGTKSQKTVRHYATLMASILHQRGIKLLIVACNTATAAALPHLKSQFPDLPIVGVIEPGAKAAIEATRSQHVVLLATETTIKSNVYQDTLLALQPSVTIQSQACGLFVALAEEGCVDDQVAHCAVEKYLAPFVNSCFDTVILGCTHFPALINPICRFLGPEINVINSAYETAQTVKNALTLLELQASDLPQKPCHYLVTDLPERFSRLGKIFLQQDMDVDEVELIDYHVVPVESP